LLNLLAGLLNGFQADWSRFLDRFDIGSEERGDEMNEREKDRQTFQDSAVGAVMGALIGDALGLGCHWYYDLDLLRADYGDWISDYTTSKPDRKDHFGYIARHRYEQGLRAGDVSQTGQVAILLLESVAETGDYHSEDFTSRLDELLTTLDGTPLSGRFTDWAMRDVWKERKAGRPWEKVGSRADTGEAAIRSVILAARYSRNPDLLASKAFSNILLTHREPYTAAQSLAFALTVSSLIQGTPLVRIRDFMANLANNPFIQEWIPSFDCLTQVGNGAQAAKALGDLKPPSLICSVYGLPCSLGFMLPASYCLIHRFPENFETAVLSAVNGGGNNMARAALTGALSGAMVGLKGIPDRFLKGLKGGSRLVKLAERVADLGGKK
jgi:ADP-ribosyl-[dinitrogen reductase] hydrolase